MYHVSPGTSPSGHGRTGLNSGTAKHGYGRTTFLLNEWHFFISGFYGRTTFSRFNRAASAQNLSEEHNGRITFGHFT